MQNKSELIIKIIHQSQLNIVFFLTTDSKQWIKKNTQLYREKWIKILNKENLKTLNIIFKKIKLLRKTLEEIYKHQLS